MKDRPHIETILFPIHKPQQSYADAFEDALDRELLTRGVLSILAVHELVATFHPQTEVDRWLLIIARCCLTCHQQPSLPGLQDPGKPQHYRPVEPSESA